MILVVDGQYQLRQVLHPESIRKDFQLQSYYNSFIDLKKIIQSVSPASATSTLDEVVTCNINTLIYFFFKLLTFKIGQVSC